MKKLTHRGILTSKLFQWLKNGIPEKELPNLTGNNKQNPTFDIPCREIYEHGQKEIEVEGPITEIAEDILVKKRQLFGSELIRLLGLEVINHPKFHRLLNPF